jgi:hypothetical protein
MFQPACVAHQPKASHVQAQTLSVVRIISQCKDDDDDD